MEFFVEAFLVRFPYQSILTKASILKHLQPACLRRLFKQRTKLYKRNQKQQQVKLISDRTIVNSSNYSAVQVKTVGLQGVLELLLVEGAIAGVDTSADTSASTVHHSSHNALLTIIRLVVKRSLKKFLSSASSTSILERES